jgi:hypothetical protein
VSLEHRVVVASFSFGNGLPFLSTYLHDEVDEGEW